MNKIYIPTTSAKDWRRFLAEPKKQWCKGYSARELAECWERAGGFPPELQALFANATDPALIKLELLLAIPNTRSTCLPLIVTRLKMTCSFWRVPPTVSL